MEEQKKYWREVHRLSVQAEEAHAALDGFFKGARASYTEEELATYDKLNNAAIEASLQWADYCQQASPSGFSTDLRPRSESIHLGFRLTLRMVEKCLLLIGLSTAFSGPNLPHQVCFRNFPYRI